MKNKKKESRLEENILKESIKDLFTLKDAGKGTKGFAIAALVFASAMILGFGGNNAFNYIKHHLVNSPTIGIEYKHKNRMEPSKLYGYDLDNNGNIDRIIDAFWIGGIYNTSQYSPKDKEFSELNEIFKEKK